MKKALLIILLLIGFAASAKAQEIVDTNGRYPYFKEKYEWTFNAPFEKAWNSVKELMTELGGQIAVQKSSQDEEGKYKGTLKSDNIIIAEGIDTTYHILQQYENKMIDIPNCQWVTARVNYKATFNEIDENTTKMQLIVQLSGFEKKISNQFHFIVSNGLKEKDFYEKLVKKLGIN